MRLSKFPAPLSAMARRRTGKTQNRISGAVDENIGLDPVSGIGCQIPAGDFHDRIIFNPACFHRGVQQY